MHVSTDNVYIEFRYKSSGSIVFIPAVVTGKIVNIIYRQHSVLQHPYGQQKIHQKGFSYRSTLSHAVTDSNLAHNM